MKRIKQLWPKIITFRNLLLAFKKARKGKRQRQEVIKYHFHLEDRLIDLLHELKEHRYRPQAYRQYLIYDRKPRLISVAPFVDRIAQHGVMNILDPAVDKRFIYHSFACRKNKGVHRAVDCLQQYMQGYPYLLKLDIASYFPSIDHAILKQKLAAMLADKDLLQLLHTIIDSAPPSNKPPIIFNGDDLIDLMRPRGLPIGNLTSQFFGNFYLNSLDHFIKDELGVPAYLRYVDDLVLLDNSKQRLWAYHEQIAQHLRGERLMIHPRKCWVQPSHSGVEFLGYWLWPKRRRLRPDNGYSFRRKLAAMAAGYRAGTLEHAEIQQSIKAWLGHAQHGDTHGLRRRIFAAQSFTRGRHPDDPGFAGRFVEQQPSEASFRQTQQEQPR